MTQTFVTGTARPWALVRVQGNGQPGRRPPTSVAWLEYPKKNDAGEIVGWYGGLCHTARAWRGGYVFSYKHQKLIAAADVLHVFPITKERTMTGKSISGHVMHAGPWPKLVKAAKAALPVIIADAVTS